MLFPICLLLGAWDFNVNGLSTHPTLRSTYERIFNFPTRRPIILNGTIKIPGVNLPPDQQMGILKKLVNFFDNEFVKDEKYFKKRRQHQSHLFMDKRCRVIEKARSKAVHFKWIYEANLTEYNRQQMIEANIELEDTTKMEWKRFKNYNWTDELEDPYVLPRFYRKLDRLIGELRLPQNKLDRYKEILSHMEETYDTAKVCKYKTKKKKKCDLALDPDIKRIFATSRKPKELKHYWVEWREASGKKISREMFEEYVTITNEVARLNNYTDAVEMWNFNYEMKNFTNEVSRLWNEIKPLYEQLHAYVRNRLRSKYGNKVVPKQGAIPVHLLGDMWGKTWTNIYDITAPYPEAKLWNITEALVQQNYTPIRMFRQAENFYESLSLGPMSGLFWDRSIFERIKNRNMKCEPSAWNFFSKHDYRIRMCTKVTYEDFLRVHHEMGHIWYFRHYEGQPIIYKDSANKAFHECLGDLINLSVITPSHLKNIGLVPQNAYYTPHMEINQLYLTALEKLPILPFSYVMDLWRWDVFKGKINSQNYNKHWWNLRFEYQGVTPPVPRNESHFDPASTYHVVKNLPHIQYFMSIFHQFQFHRTFCNFTSITRPLKTNSRVLHLCDIYKCDDCGHALWNFMFRGSSKTWRWIMTVAIDQWWNDVESVKEYFEPLMNWLIKYNEKSEEHIGWMSSANT